MIAEPRRDDLIAMYQNLISEAERAAFRIEDDFIRHASGFPVFAGNINEQLRTIREPFRLGVVGMFKSGKSSVLNTFLQRDVLKEGPTETTSVLTEMIFAESQEQERGEILFKDGTAKKCLTIGEALEYTDIRSLHFQGDDERRRHEQQKIDRVRVYIHSGLLQNVVMVDTPGFGGSEIGDVMAFDALKAVDAALMIFSADRTGAEEELRIADELNRKGREVVAMLNQCDDGKGNFRKEEEIQECEQFIREHFQTLVKSNNGDALIFRYSALEIKKILKKAEHTSDDVELLQNWGGLPKGERDEEKGSAQFLRDRYFSGEAASRKKKMNAAKAALLSEINRLLESSGSELHKTEERHKELATFISHTRKEIEERILSKMPIIENKLEEEVRTLVREYARNLADVLDSLLEEIKDFGVLDLVKSFKSQDKTQKDFEQRFRHNFPESNDEILVKRIIRQSERLLRHHWQQIGQEMDGLNIKVEGLSIEGMLARITNALRGISSYIAGTVVAMIALVFNPVGFIVVSLLAVLSAVRGYTSSGRVPRLIAQAQRQMRNRVRHEADMILDRSMDELIKINNQLADKLKESIKMEAKPAEEESGHLVVIIEVLKQAQATFENRSKMIQEYDFMSATTEAL